MAFQKGKDKTGGKIKGTENKVTKTARDIFKATLEDQTQHISASFDKVRKTDPVKYLELFSKYAQYFMPKQVDITSKGEEVKQVFKIGGVEIEL